MKDTGRAWKGRGMSNGASADEDFARRKGGREGKLIQKKD